MRYAHRVSSFVRFLQLKRTLKFLVLSNSRLQYNGINFNGLELQIFLEVIPKNDKLIKNGTTITQYGALM